MTARSFFLSLRRTSNTIIKNNACSEAAPHSRFLSSRSLRSDVLEESSTPEGKDDLKTRIFTLRLPKRSVINVIQKWVSEGNQTSMLELRQIQKELRKSQRYKHALEISEWMVSHDEFVLSDSDYAIRIDLMTKVFGIDAAERYFEGLPLSAKTSETCTALLHSYAGAKLMEKAEQFYERIKDSNLSFSALMYNEMMTLYMSVGQVEKVALVVEELKRKHVVPDIFTYNLWISSCASTLNIDEVRKILDEMSIDSGSNGGLSNYINLVKIYIEASHLVNAESSPLVEADKSITQREWITYDFLIILYAGLGNKDKIDQIWKSLRMTKQKMTSRNYICILSSYLMLGHMKEIEEVIDQWKQSTTSEFDISACNRLLYAFKDVGLIEKANDFHMLLLQKNCSPTNEQG
ncbi:pentatricopeptide repeat-containing protein At5g09450, mitochondrial [Mangifera indica]|uniref:pentatricopeptide repeat-containing protein At5g09450, mitochondrial n=1 Tax=Mangifera indica TaxID=29780 RepID=UPI001CFB46F7|nr:pentatricopeptide repeat-containing protein At5g09450, mitochondrial [Mangifera indica]XP_044509569.1 pentatricopeptide repeat-containing protein At5g09450, mitochondrial [Mangifera indica]